MSPACSLQNGRHADIEHFYSFFPKGHNVYVLFSPSIWSIPEGEPPHCTEWGQLKDQPWIDLEATAPRNISTYDLQRFHIIMPFNFVPTYLGTSTLERLQSISFNNNVIFFVVNVACSVLLYSLLLVRQFDCNNDSFRFVQRNTFSFFSLGDTSFLALITNGRILSSSNFNFNVFQMSEL